MYKVSTNGKSWWVVELPTGSTIKEFTNSQLAYAFCKDLNDGHGFEGWTPDFFLKKV